MAIPAHRYKLPQDVVIKRKGKKYLFLSPLLPAWVVTNANGAKALNLCNGKRTVEEIGKIVSKHVKRSATDEIVAFFQNIVSSTNFFSSRDLCNQIFHPYLLRTIHLNLTNRCNLSCIYCYADERSLSGDVLQFTDHKKIIDSINNIAKNVEIVLTGGEPLLVSYALDLAEYAKKNGNKPHLLSNGILINEENVKRISNIFDLVKISLDGDASEVHDYHRGKGSFIKTMKAIDLLIQNKASLKIAMTVTRKNINSIEGMATRFGSLLTFAPLFKAGRAKENKQLSITGKEYYEALYSTKGVNPLGSLCDSLERAKNQPIMKCAIGDAEISISDTGDVYPCHLLHLPQFLAGNIKEQQLESIYQNSEVLKMCRKLTVLNLKGCRKCDIKFICGGTCRARAFYENNRIDASGDFCGYEKLAYINGIFDVHEF